MREDIHQLVQYLFQVRQEIQAPGSSALPRYLAASDLHGNAYRLREILTTAEREAIDHVFLVGDLYSGPGGWGLYRLLQSYHENGSALAQRLTLMWGNHELAFVSGMLGNDRQLRFFYSYGGRELIAELNAERDRLGKPRLTLSGSPKMTAEDRAQIRSQPELRELCSWIQRTHRVFATDQYGTGYLHAFPKINRHDEFVFQYRGMQGIPALPLIEEDLRTATQSTHPVFSMLLQTETSPLWALFEISNARQFDQAVRSVGIRQIVFGHRHHTQAVNVSNLNRQIGIAVDFDLGRGGYVIIGPKGLTFRRFIDRDSHLTTETEIVAPAGRVSARDAHLSDIEEFLFRRLVQMEQDLFARLPLHSAQARSEFAYLETLRQQGFPWIHRLYAELYNHIKDSILRTDMFRVTVESGDEDAFRSFIHLLFRTTRELESHGNDWYGEAYLKAKSVMQVLMTALRDMPVSQLGLLDVKLRGTTSRFNLTELYKRILELEDPELALLAVQNLGILRIPPALQELRRAFFHDVRKVRVKAAEVLANLGELAYPLVAPLLRNSDGWVRCLAMWTLAELSVRRTQVTSESPPTDLAGNGLPHSPVIKVRNEAADRGLRSQAILDLRRKISREEDWFLYMLGKELLRKLDDPKVDDFPDKLEIPNLSDAIIATLQELVDTEREPFRKAFKVFFITIELSSLVYRRGLIGLDIDDLKIYVNDIDYFPPYYKNYKSGDRDMDGVWRGWRKLWIRGETANLPDGPQIAELEGNPSQDPPSGPRTIVLYDHRSSNGRVTIPPLADVIEQHGLGKIKDRIRHELLLQWERSFSRDEQALLSRIHAAALMKMLFDLPSEIFVSPDELKTLIGLSQKTIGSHQQKERPFLKLTNLEFGSRRRNGKHPIVAYPQWLDVPKYSVTVHLRKV